MPSGAPPIGYPDWQRVTNWDGPALLSTTAKEVSNYLSPIMDVSRYANLKLGLIDRQEEHTLTYLVTLYWYAQGNGESHQLGEQAFVLNPDTSYQGQSDINVTIPNRGPWVQLKISEAQGRGPMNIEIYLGTDNRVGLPPTAPRQPSLLAYSKNILSGATAHTWPTYNWTGSAVLSIARGGAAKAFTIQIEAYDAGLKEWVHTWVASLEPGEFYQYTVPCPYGSWRLGFTNATTATVNVEAYMDPVVA
ncbi:MAG: hypothetical protein ACRDX8_08810 [Acidimicrobiales bacterium]